MSMFSTLFSSSLWGSTRRLLTEALIKLQCLSEKHMWFDFTHGFSRDLKVWESYIYNNKKKPFIINSRQQFIFDKEGYFVCRGQGVLVCACLHAYMLVIVHVWVFACKFSISPQATPTHSEVSHSLSKKDPVKQSNLNLNLYDCTLAVFILPFANFYMPDGLSFTGSSHLLACGGGVLRQRTFIIHNYCHIWRPLVRFFPAIAVYGSLCTSGFFRHTKELGIKLRLLQNNNFVVRITESPTPIIF